MIATLTVIILALAWLGKETRWLTIRLPYGKVQSIKQLPAGQPVLLLKAGNLASYPMVSPELTVSQLREVIDTLAKTEIEVELEV